MQAGGGGGAAGQEAALCLSRPNDNLAVEYLRALPERMGALAVRRVGAEHDGAPVGGYASASAIRGWLRCGKIQRAEAYLPEPWQGDVASMEWCERAVLSRLRTMCPEEAERLPDSGEGVAARLISAGRGGPKPGGTLCAGKDQAIRPRTHPEAGAVGLSGPRCGGSAGAGALSAGAGL